MSAISVPAPIDLEVAVRPRPAVVGLPGNVFAPPLVAPRRSRSHARTANLLASVLLNGMILSAFALLTYVASGFAGNVELEAANRDAIRSADRAGSASLAVGGLRKAVDNLEQDETVERWARFNNFVPPYKLAASLAAKK